MHRMGFLVWTSATSKFLLKQLSTKPLSRAKMALSTQS